MEARQRSHRRSIPTKTPHGRLGQTAAAPRSILKARLYRMTASFTEQMVNLYTELGMLSSSKLLPLPSWKPARCGRWERTYVPFVPVLAGADLAPPRAQW
jgi:hypothetical protein